MGRIKRLILPTLLGAALYFAVFGGEHSLFDVQRARDSIQAESVELAELSAEVDSLRARADSLESDSATLERIARERFGMVRDGEILYRFAEPQAPDSVEAGER